MQQITEKKKKGNFSYIFLDACISVSRIKNEVNNDNSKTEIVNLVWQLK